MKLNIYKKLGYLIVFLLGFSCSGDWLDQQSVQNVGETTVFETTENTKAAVKGLYRLMKRHYVDTQGWNGEGVIKLIYGNVMGVSMIENKGGSPNTTNGVLIDRNTGRTVNFPWFYYYKIIGNANSIIERVDDAEGPTREKESLKAQALSMRAYSYFQLLQFYGNRWKDMDNGDTDAVVLRLKPNSDHLPLSSFKEVLDQVYDDLYTAIDLFESSNFQREQIYEINLAVAQAILARVALTVEDYETAKKYSALARKDYPLMTNQEYMNGFANPNQEWLWANDGTPDESTGFWYFHGYVGYNGSGSNVRNYPKLMYKPLYESLPESDIRRELFLDPQGMSYNSNNGTAGKELEAYARDKWTDIQSDAKIVAYMQFKFKANELPGAGYLNHIRSSELFLIEAEAEYFLENEDNAQRLMEELTKDSGRDPEYVCDKTGDELFSEIKRYRNIELWAEGFDWFDLKRWGDPVERKGPDEGGNFLTNLAVTYDASAYNKWKWRIPQIETDFNDEISPQ